MRRVRLLWFLTALPLILMPPLLMGMGPIEWPRWFDRFVPRKADGRSTRGSVTPTAVAAAPVIPADFEFLADSGVSFPVAEGLCPALAAEVPGWSTGGSPWCATASSGAWTSAAGSAVTSWTSANSPTYVNAPQVPSGLDGEVETVVGLNGTNQKIYATNSAPTGDTTVCVLVRPQEDPAAQYGPLITMDGPSRVYLLDYTSGAYRILPFYSGVAGTAVSGGAARESALSLVCAVYDYVTSGTSTLTLYVDGTSVGTPITNAAGPLTSATQAEVVGSENQYSNYASVLVNAAARIDQALSAGQISAITRRVLADSPKTLADGVASTALTYTRTNGRYCSKADNTGTVTPANRVCFARGKMLIERAATNSMTRSQEIDNAVWSKAAFGVAAPTVTANYAVGPDGTKTAERVEIPATTAAQYSVVSQTGLSNGTRVGSLFVKGTGGSGTIHLCLENTTYACTACNYVSTSWTRCEHTSTVQNFVGGVFLFGNPGVLAFPAPASSAVDVIVWGAQGESGAVATSHVPTAGSTVALGADLASVAYSPAAVTTGSMAFNVSFTTATSNTGWFSADATTTPKQSIQYQTSTIRTYVDGVSQATSAITVGDRRVVGYWTVGASSAIGVDGAFTSGTAPGAAAATDTLRFGNYGNTAAQVQTGWYSSFCYDVDPARCR